MLLCLPAEKLFSKSAKSLVRSSIQAERGWDWDLSCDRVEQDSGSPLHSLGRVVPQSGSSLLSPRYDVIPSQSRGYPPVHIYIRYRFRGPQILRAQIYDYNTHGNPPPPRGGSNMFESICKLLFRGLTCHIWFDFIFEAKYIGRKCLCHSIGINKICGNKSLSEHFEGNLSYISFEC